MTIKLLCGKCNSEFEKTICDECWDRLLKDAERAGHVVELIDSLNVDERQDKDSRRGTL